MEENYTADIQSVESGAANEPNEADRHITCQTRTVLNEKALVALTRQTFSLMMKLMGVVAGIFLVLGLAQYFSGSNKTVAIIVMIAGVTVPALILFVAYFLVPGTVSKSSNKILGLIQTISFGDSVYVEDNSQMLKGGGEVNWLYIARAVETNEYFFIYINKYSAYVVDKSGFTLGSADILRAILRNKLGKNLKSKIK